MVTEISGLAACICCLAFFMAGIVDSITGGGGLITIPAMMAVGIPVHLITGTNQFAAWPGSVAAAGKYIKSGEIHLPSALLTLPFALAGSYLGARANLMVPDRFLKIFMLATVPVIAVLVFSNRQAGSSDETAQLSRRRLLLCPALIGCVIGFYQGFYGPGSGLFFMLAYAFLLKMSLLRAAGNTRFVVSVASTVSVLTYALSGAVLWKLAAASALFNIVGSYLGAVLAIREGAKIIRPIMLCVTALLLLRLLADLLPVL